MTNYSTFETFDQAVLAKISVALAEQEEARRAAYQARLAFETDALAWLADLAAQGNKYAEFIVDELRRLESNEEDY